MTVCIPVFGILQFLLVYMVIGAILAPPLAAWQSRFIAGNSKWNDGIRWTRAVLITAVAWPIILGFNVKTEIEYRKKGYL